MIGERIGNHVIVSKIGQGGMGTVYQAEDTTLGRKVAVKILNPRLLEKGGKELERFQAEAKIQASLNHPNIVTLYEFQPYKDSHCMVMEYVEGKTLAETIRSSGPLPPHIVVNLAKQILEGLSAAHRRGIVHRDLKPSNVTVTPDGVAKVMDFGIAKVQGGKTLTESGALVGTVSYMSPEQVRGLRVDARSDLYSFGIILFEMLTGRVPFKEDSDFSIMMHHVQTPPPPPTQLLPDIPTALEDVVMRCLGKDPAARYQNAEEIIAVLNAFEEQERAMGRSQLYSRRYLAEWLAAPRQEERVPAAGAEPSPSVPPPILQPPPQSQASAPAQQPSGAPEAPPIAPIPSDNRVSPPVPGAVAPAKKTLLPIILVCFVFVAAAGAAFYLWRLRTSPPQGSQTAQTTQTKPLEVQAGVAIPAQQGGSSTAPGSPQTPSEPATASTAPGTAEQSVPLAAQAVAPPPGVPATQSMQAGRATAPGAAGVPLPSTASTAPGAPEQSVPLGAQAIAPPSGIPATRSVQAEQAAAPGGAVRTLPWRAATKVAKTAQEQLPQGFLIFMDLDRGSEQMALGTAQAQVAQIVRDRGYKVVSAGVVGANVRAALDRHDLAEVRRNGVGYVIMGTVHGAMEAQAAYGSTYYVGQVTANLELVRMSDGEIAATGSGDAKSRGSANAQAAINSALLSAASDAARELMRRFNP